MTIVLFTALLLGFMAIGMPIAYALLATGVGLMFYLNMWDAQVLAQNLLNGGDSFPLLAAPFFVLAGEIMNVGGLSRRIIDVAVSMFGHFKGGLGYVVVFSSVLLSALSGSAIADAAALGALLIPMMVRAGHDKTTACGLVASCSTIGPIIPPSIAFIVFAVAADLSASKLLLAGIVPGLYMAVALVVAWWWVSRNDRAEPFPRKSLSEVLASLRSAVWALVLPIIIIVGLKFGIFTPTEAGVVAAVYSLFIAMFVYKELKFKQLFEVFFTAAQTTALVMFLVASALAATWMITVADIPQDLVAIFRPFLDSPMMLMIVINVVIFVLGTILDVVPIILILTPVVMPLVVAAKIDPIYFGVVFMINNVIGLITPPVGTLLNVVAGVGRISMDSLMKGVMPFMVALTAVLLLLIAFPALVIVPARWFY